MVTTRQKILFFSIIIVICVGIGSRVFQVGWGLFDKYLGDVLYAVLLYLFLCLLWEKSTPVKRAILACGVMIVIETFQLTGLALQFSRSSSLLLKLIAVVLGTSFSWLDMLAYLVGILGIYVFDQYVT